MKKLRARYSSGPQLGVTILEWYAQRHKAIEGHLLFVAPTIFRWLDKATHRLSH